MRFLRAPGDFEGLTLAGWGLWLFRVSVLSAAVSPDDGGDSPQAAHPKRSCRLAETVKSTLMPRLSSATAQNRVALSS